MYMMDGMTVRTQPTVVVLIGYNLVPLVSEEFVPKDAYPYLFQEEEVLPED